MFKTLLVTGAAGFIGSNFVDAALEKGYRIVALDKLNYCGNLENLIDARQNDRFAFIEGDVADTAQVLALLQTYQVNSVVHFAAQTHVDRSIKDPTAFIEDNVVGSQHLLDASLQYWKTLDQASQRAYRHIHISTDEVFGDLTDDEAPFTETSPYCPNSPYSASKAAADMFVRAYGKTYGLPVVIVHPSNNYGPRQFPEKLIPLMIQRALAGDTLPIYGTGKNRRDWMHVSDHCRALLAVIEKAKASETFNIGSGVETTNIEIVETLCAILDQKRPKTAGHYRDQIEFVADRPGHDWRYAMDTKKAHERLGFRTCVSLQAGLEATVDWYLENAQWVEHILTGQYRQWIDSQYGVKRED